MAFLTRTLASLYAPRGAERRRSARHRVGREASWKIRIFIDQNEHLAGVHDISARGIGLVFDRSLPVGQAFTAEVTNTMSLVLSARLVHVVHVAALPGGDYLIGCQFDTPLPPELLEPFLK